MTSQSDRSLPLPRNRDFVMGIPDGGNLHSTRVHLGKLHYKLRRLLPMWVVYHTETREYPGQWVARMHIALPAPKASRFVIACPSIGGVRGLIPLGLCRISRHPSDPPEIEEVWL